MIMRIKNIHVQFSLLMLILICAGCSNNLKKNEIDELQEMWNALKELELNIAVVVSDKETSPRLAFIAKNKSKIDVAVPEIFKNANRLEILKPNSKHPISFSVSSGMSREVVIKSSKEKIWYLNIIEFFDGYKEEGIYHIKWKVHDQESQEILLLREKDIVKPIEQ